MKRLIKRLIKRLLGKRLSLGISEAPSDMKRLVKRLRRAVSKRFYRVWASLPFPWLTGRIEGRDCSVILDEPLILYLLDYLFWNSVLGSEDNALLPVYNKYRDRPVYLLVGIGGFREGPDHLADIVRLHDQHMRRYPGHRIIYLANTETHHRVLEAAGLRSAFVNNNAFVDPEIYRPLPGVPKRFDAIYDARVDPVKRHYLAAATKSLALVAERLPHHHDAAYVRSVSDLLPQAHWYNHPLSPDYRSFPPAEVNLCTNECRVGLCLSAREGAMYSSIQYLLAGLPVVSTASEGGRDVFFDPDYTCIVADDPEAVAAGVAEMCRCRVPPEEIRNRTLAKMAEHLDRLFGLLDEVLSAEGLDLDLRPTFSQWGPRAGGFGRTTNADLFERIQRRARYRANPRVQV